ncbi:hypothetical protein [Ruegeria arenilitoris]|uniref:hypothetical protein n=1 Tax=Ruegeria arenilitoris TaxID=1173585 RepID=UPI00147B0789|nr:hypothetical protein [Ruegeria arenilitoris]
MTAKGKTIPVAALAIATLVSACSEEVTNQKIEEWKRDGSVDFTVGELLSGVIPQQETAPAKTTQSAPRRTASVVPTTSKPIPTSAPSAPAPILTQVNQAPVSTAKRQVDLEDETNDDKVEINLIE